MTTRHLNIHLLLLSALLCTQIIFGQTVSPSPGSINTYAGSDALFENAGQPATAAQIVSPHNIAIDVQGNIYFSATGQSMVLKIASNGIISVAAGNGLSSGAGDGGPAVGASLSTPEGLAFDPPGNLYILDWANSNVRKVDSKGIITTVAGGHGQAGFSGDGGLATEALLRNPTAIVFDKSGNMYIADRGNNRIRKVAADTGIISTIAGSDTTGLSGDGAPAASATFTLPTDITIDSSGNLYVADTNNWVVRKISTSGIISTVAGNGEWGYSGDGGQATQTKFKGPTGVAVDAAGNLYITDPGNARVRRVAPNGIITTIAGTGTAGFSGDNAAATAAQFSSPVSLAVDATGAVYVSDLDNNRIRRVVPDGAVTTVAGTGNTTGDNGPSTQARLNGPWSVAVDATGNLYIADRSDSRVRKVTPSGTITTIAGNGRTGFGGDNGPGTAAMLNTPNGVAVDSAGNLYIADASNNEIRRVDAITGTITAFAGTGACCYAGTGTGGDGGAATDATLYYPTSVAVDGAGNVYFTDEVQSSTSPLAFAVRRVTPDGKINTWAGGGKVPGYGGDGGPALQAQFGAGINLAVSANGTLYIADANNNRVRKVDAAGATITTVAGNGQATDSGDGGDATQAGVTAPWSVVADAVGNLYISELSTVRKVTPTGIISTYAGSRWGFSGDGGPATAASFAGVAGLALDSGNNLYAVDSGNRRIRQVQPLVSPAIALSSTSLNFTLAALSSTSTTQTFVLTNGGQGMLNWAASATATSGGAWLKVSPSTGNILAGQTVTTVTVSVDPSGLGAGDYYGQIQVTSPNASSPVQMITVRLTVQTAGEDPPQIRASEGVLNSASYVSLLAPGTEVAIFGSKLTDVTPYLIEDGFPWPTQLGGTSVTIGGVALPLYMVSPGQINAILPYGLAVDTSLPVVVTRGNAVSAPQAVSMVSSQPGAFTRSQDGQGMGAIIIVHPGGSWDIADAGHPASAGDAVEIYCTGLGDVTPRAVAGYPATVSPLLWVIDPVTLTIGGVKVPVSFAGLTPGLTGLYQVNATIPAGIAPSQQVPLVLSQGGRPATSITIPIQ